MAEPVTQRKTIADRDANRRRIGLILTLIAFAIVVAVTFGSMCF